jgi:sugar phosphate isomerase/epimerase
MVKIAFSTVACPEWTLERVAAAAVEFGFESIELRTFGDASRLFACDPALTHAGKVRQLFFGRGIEICSLATSARFDEPVSPPVVGVLIGDTEREVRAARRAVDLAVALEAPYVRVFGFQAPRREKLAATEARIAKRLAMVVDHAHNTGVGVVLENGGSFPTAAHLVRLMDRLKGPLLGACYGLAPAWAAREDPARGIDTLGDRLWVARIKDLRDGRPCPLGQGELPCRSFVHALTARRFAGPLVYEWDRAWIPGLAPADAVLPDVARTLWGWIGEARTAAPAPALRPVR